jgi:ABC-type multidrug transport system fused ATPase/permease subunit
MGALQGSMASARRVYETLHTEPEIAERANTLEAPVLRGELRFEQVSFAYQASRPVLEDISFTVKPGQMVALVGLTGAGKTTLVSLIPRFYEPAAGRVLLDGVDVLDRSLKAVREGVSLVLQEPILFSASIADNIRYGRLDATLEEIEAAAQAAQAHEFISELPDGYATELGEDGAGLSGGERQRLSIARALLKDAPVLILDEPTSSLDARSEAKVFAALRRLMQGRTTIVIAHRLSTIRDADNIIVLENGRIAGQGRHEDLLASNALYRELCERLSLGLAAVEYA